MIAIRTENDLALKHHPEILKARQTYQTSQTDLRNAKGQKYQSDKQLQLAQASASGALRRARDIDARIAYLARAISSREARLRQLERVPAIGCMCQLP